MCSWIYVDAAVLSTVLWIGRRSWLKVPACQSVLFLDSYRCYLTFLAKIFIYCFILCLLLTLFLKPWSMSTWSSQSFVGPNYRTGGSERKRKLSQFVSLVMSCPPELFVMSDLCTPRFFYHLSSSYELNIPKLAVAAASLILLLPVYVLQDIVLLQSIVYDGQSRDRFKANLLRTELWTMRRVCRSCWW